MDRTCPGNEFTCMSSIFWNEILVTLAQLYPFTIDDERILSLDNRDILIVCMDMFFGFTICFTDPICHLFVICSIIYPSLDTLGL